MGDNDNKELQRILKKSIKKRLESPPVEGCDPVAKCGESRDGNIFCQSYVQWTTNNGTVYIPAPTSAGRIPAGVYEIKSNPQIGIYFEKIPINIEGILRLPDTNSDAVIREINLFWDKKSEFQRYKLPHRRGILLWGPPGSGKTCTIKLAISDLVNNHDGVIIRFHPRHFLEGIRIFRQVQPDTPVIVLMEDIDSSIEAWPETEILNILDGVERIDGVIFLATTNYPEKLGARIVNRPSRFDKRFKIGHPSVESRELFIKHLFLGRVPGSIDVSRWVKDTDGMSLSHLGELFRAVHILGDDYEETIETLRTMSDYISSEQDNELHIGFGNANPENG